MGVTTLDIEVANIAKPEVTRRLKFIVDSGSTYSVVPASVLRQLGIRPLRRQILELADGSDQADASAGEALDVSAR